MPKVILDCDPGHDDAVAILLATGHPDVEIHGDTGMEIHGFELPEPRVAPESTHAVRWMIDTLMREEPGSVSVIPTGPLTNLALAARLEPRIVDRYRLRGAVAHRDGRARPHPPGTGHPAGATARWPPSSTRSVFGFWWSPWCAPLGSWLVSGACIARTSLKT